MIDSTETTNPGRTTGRSRVRMLAIGALTAVALSLPALSAAAVVGHDAYRTPRHSHVTSDSQRLALSVRPASVRLT